MIIGEATSINKVKIRLTAERWKHITYSHKEIDAGNFSEILEVIGNPNAVLKGDKGEFLAAGRKSRSKYWLVVIYKELTKADGFVITAYYTSDVNWLFKRKIIWNKK